MTTETKESVPVLDILEEGGVIEISRLSDGHYSAGLRPSVNTGYWHAEATGITPSQALNGILAHGLTTAHFRLSEREVLLCRAALSFTLQAWPGGPRYDLYVDFLHVWLRTDAPKTCLLPPELLDFMTTSAAFLYAYATSGGSVLEQGSSRLFKQNEEVRKRAAALAIRLAGAHGWPADQAAAQLREAVARTVACDELPVQVELPLKGAL